MVRPMGFVGLIAVEGGATRWIAVVPGFVVCVSIGLSMIICG